MKSNFWQSFCRLIVAAQLATVWFAGVAGAQIDRNAVQMWMLQGQEESVYLERLEGQAARMIDEVKRVVTDRPLSAAQEAKLQLAMKGLTSRFKQDLTYYAALTGELNMNDGKDQQKAAQIMAPAMQKAQQGWYGKEFFEQMVNRTLDIEQQKRLDDRRRVQREQRHRALALRMVADVDARLALTKAQRETLVELMNKQDIAKVPQNYDTIVGHMKILRIPEKELDAFLDAKQRESLRAIVEPYRNIEARFP